MSKGKKTKRTNPRNIPRSEADVIKAYKNGYNKGYNKGIDGALILFLFTLKDKFGASDEELTEFSKAFTYQVDSINKGFASDEDLATVLREEYGLTIEYDDDDERI